MNRTAIALGACSLSLAIPLAILASRHQSGQRQVEELRTQLQVVEQTLEARNAPSLIAEQCAPATKSSNSGDSLEVDTSATPSQVATTLHEEKLLRDPAYRKLRIEGDKHALWRVHGEAISTIALPPDLADRLMKLLAQHQLEGAEQPLGIPEGTSRYDPRIDLNNPPVWFARLRAREQRQQAEVEALLGPTKHREWIEFYETKFARYEVGLLEKEVERLGDPLRADQRKALVDLITEAERRQESAYSRLSPSSPFRAGTPDDHLATLEADAERIAKSTERLRQLAASYLTPRQLEVYETSLSRKLERAKAQVDLQRASIEVLAGR